jgi:hypothetical protein
MNKNSLSIIFLFISQFACLWTNGQSQFYKKLNGLSVSYEIKALATPDGGWITGGTSNGVKLVKYDKCGSIQWSRHYTSIRGIDYVEIVASAFGGYAVTGYWGPRSNADTYLLRLDDNGNVIYCKQYLAASSEFPYSLGEDSNGNFFINGNTINGGGLGNNFILKTDSLGNIIWSKLYADGGSWGRAIVCKDDGILRCGGWGNLYKVDNSGLMSGMYETS